MRPAQCKTTVRPKLRQRSSSRGSRAGFANVEEEFADEYIGRQVMPWRIEDAANDRGANYVQAGRFKPFAIRDGRLITSQQQYSGAEVAKLVVESLGT